MRRLLCLALFAAGPLFASEVPVAPPVLKQASSGGRFAGATDGAGVLVVWSDGERIRYALVGYGAPADVPARLLASREASNFAAWEFSPFVAFADGRYLIVWGDYPRSEAALLDRNGEVLRTISIAQRGRLPVVASANGRFLVAWTTPDGRGGAAAILSRDGDVVSSMSFPFGIAAACASAGAFAILGAPQRDCATSTNCTYRQTVTRISPDGNITAQANTDTLFDWHYVPLWYSMASGSDGGLLIAWDDSDRERAVGFLLDFHLHRVSGNVDFGSSGWDRLTVFWDRSRYVVVTNSPFYGARALAVGIDWEPIEIGPDVLDPYYGVIVPTDAGYFAIVGPAYSPHDYPIEAIFHTDLRLDRPFDKRAVERWRFTIVEDQSISSIATDGRSVLAAWSQPLRSDSTRKNALVSNGSARDLGDSQTFPMTFDGTEFVSRSGCEEIVGYLCGGEATMRFRSADGITTEDVTVPGVSYALWNGSLFFVFRLHLESPDIFNYPLSVRRFRRSGEAIDTGSIIAVGDLEIVSTATNGHDAFFVLHRFPFITKIEEYVLGCVTPEGVVTMSQPLQLISPKLAVAGDVVFVTGTLGASLVVTSYSADLRARWPAPIALSQAIAGTPAIAAEGRNAVVVWHESRRVVGARVTPQGNAAPFVVAEGSDPVSQPHVASARGVTAVAYERLVSEEPYRGARRIFVQFLDAPPRRHAAGR
jgi:hypothetical protein